MDFDTILKKIAMDLCELDLDNPAPKTQRILEYVGTSQGLDRIYYCHFSEDGTFMYLHHIWSREGISTKRIPMMEEVAYEYPWLVRTLKQGKNIILTSMDELPEAAFSERTMLDSEGVKSCLVIPMQEAGKVVGFYGFETVTRQVSWDSEFVLFLMEAGQLMFSKMQDRMRIKRLDKALYEQSMLLDYSNVHLFALKNPTVYAGVNDAHAEFFGKIKEDLQNQNLFDIFPPDTANQLCQDNLSLFELKTSSSKEIWVKNGKGQKRLLLIKSQPKTDSSGNIEYLVCTAEDVTEQRKIQRDLVKAKKAAEAANVAKSEFLANMSHEIRTPMNGILGFMQLLSSTELTNEQRDFLKEINHSTEALLYIINDILDFSKIEAGRMVMEEISFNLRSTVESTVTLSAPAVSQKGLEIYTFIKPSVPKEVMGDPGRLRQVLNNLINNAVKFTHSGEIIISVDTVEQDDHNCLLSFEVSDTGIGISEDHLGELFTQFTQADASTTRKYGGTGLGLAICKRLVELMNGTISVTSKPEEGSKFFFTCQVKKCVPDIEPTLEEITNLQGMKVLVMDPQPNGRKLIRYYLEGTGCHLYESDNCHAAMELIQKHEVEGSPFTAFIVSMPHSSEEICDASGNIAALKLKAPPQMIMLISYAQKGEAEAARKMGFSVFLTRPIKRDELIESLGLAVYKSAKETENTEIITKHSVHELQFDKKPRLLVVEDNEINQKFIMLLLKRYDLVCDIAFNGQEAINACLAKDYDLILMDCQMPEMDGYLATTHIRKNEAGRRHTPIIALTANALEGDREKCIEAGMDDYVAKPLKKDQLLEVVNKYFNMSK